MKKSNIPCLFIKAKTLPEAWEKAIVQIWQKGAELRTEYDKKNSSGEFIDPPSKDATVMIEVTEPFAEPRIHKNFPGGPAELEIYRQEVVKGIHDHWVDPEDKDKWTYTYHGRLFKYIPTEDLENPSSPKLNEINQIEYAVNKLCETHFTRRAQAITWMPTADTKLEDPPCLQRLWFRLVQGEKDELFLNLNTHWRSRDAYKAWFMNAFAMTDLQKKIAEQISEKIKEPVKVGRYVDISDSLHIYGSYFSEFQPEYEKIIKDPDYTKRAFKSGHPAIKMMFEEAREKLKSDPDFMLSK